MYRRAEFDLGSTKKIKSIFNNTENKCFIVTPAYGNALSKDGSQTF